MENIMGAMVDCSRNRVMKVDQVKKYAKTIKAMGHNTLMLYTEDTYEIDGHPYFGHFRGRYTKDELKEINAYCDEIGIELIPCIQTLGHLERMFQWETVYDDINDCKNILLVGAEKTYGLIDAMFKTISECFTTKKIHIGMDETQGIGEGKYKALNGVEKPLEIMSKHLNRLSGMLDKYGFEPMVWSDMFCHAVTELEKDHTEEEVKKIMEEMNLPKNLTMVYWEYYYTNPEIYQNMMRIHKIINRKVVFAGAAYTWVGIAPDNAHSMRVTEVAFTECHKEGVDDTILTSWGDDGAQCSPFTVLPALMHAVEFKKGNTDLDSIRKKFKEITGVEFEDFMLLDRVNQIGDDYIRSGKPLCDDLYHMRHLRPTYILYGDIFMDKKGELLSMSDGPYFKDLAEKIHNVKEKGDYAHLFDMYEALCRVFEIKSTIGIEIRDAYSKKDLKKIAELAEKCDELVKRIKKFHSVYQTSWFIESKPHGFDVQDMKLGGLMQRITSCKERLEKLAKGEITEIPELEEPMLPATKGMKMWRYTISANFH